jgi:hypothetical protein
MAALEELLYLHPTCVVARFAAEPSPRPKKRVRKPKPAPERRVLLRRLRTLRAAT